VFRTLGWVDDCSGGCGRFQKQAKDDELPYLGKRGFDQPLVAFYPMAIRSGRDVSSPARALRQELFLAVPDQCIA
jgi:hypothetical protein